MDTRLALLAGSQNYIQPVQNALMQASQLRSQQDAQKMNALQMQDYQRRATEAMQADQQSRKDEELLRQWLSPQAGPTQDGGPVRPNIDPMALLQSGMSFGGLPKVKALQDMMQPKPRKLMTASPGQVVLDEANPTTPLYSVPETPKPKALPSAVQEYEYAKQQGYTGTYEQWDRARRKAGATNVSVGGPVQEKAEAGAVGKYFGEQFADIQRQGMAAQGMVNSLGQIESMLQGLNTGKFTETGVEIAGALRALGLNVDKNLSNKEAVAALSNEMSLQFRNPSGGAGMPGAMSDKDREFLVAMTPGLGKTPAANALIIEARRRLAKRSIEVAKLASKYRQKNGRMDDGFLDELRAYSDANPMFEDMRKTGSPQTGGGMPQAGAVVDGYRFKGGDPSKQENWERAK